MKVPENLVLVCERSAGGEHVVVCAEDGEVVLGQTVVGVGVVALDDLLTVVPAVGIAVAAAPGLCVQIELGEKRVGGVDTDSAIDGSVDSACLPSLDSVLKVFGSDREEFGAGSVGRFLAGQLGVPCVGAVAEEVDSALQSDFPGTRKQNPPKTATARQSVFLISKMKQQRFTAFQLTL